MAAESKTTTSDALLGLLHLAPMSGYELRQLIDRSIGNFWTESYGQIYPTLKKLVAEGMATAKVHAAAGKTERTVYTLTAAGRRRVAEWLQLPAQTRTPRNELLLKLFFGGFLSADVAIAQVEGFRAEQVQRIARYSATYEATERNFAGHPHLPFWLITARYGSHEAQALLAWADETLAQLSRMRKTPPVRKKGPTQTATKRTNARKGADA